MMNDTPLQIEKAKVSALTTQIQKYQKENQRLLDLLQKTQQKLEKQAQEMISRKHSHAEKEKAREKQAIAAVKLERDKAQHLREELLSTQTALTKQLSLSKQREQEHEKQLDKMSHLYEQQMNEASNDECWKSTERRINTLEKCQTGLLALVKKQMKLIEIYKEQRQHARSAVLLGIAEKTFLKEVSS